MQGKMGLNRKNATVLGGGFFAFAAVGLLLFQFFKFTNISPSAGPGPAAILPHAQSAALDDDELISLLLGKLQSADVSDRQEGMSRIRQMENGRAKLIAQGLPQWLGPMLQAKQYGDVEHLATIAMFQTPQSPEVANEQRARVVSLLAMGKYELALPAAKSYYDVALLSQTSDAMDLLSEAIAKQSGNGAVEAGFRLERGDLPALGVSPAVLKGIDVDDLLYEPVIGRLGARSATYGRSVGRGNMLLLADRPVEARQCFEVGCTCANSDVEKLHIALEGIARSIRDENLSADPANTFITALRNGDACVLPAALAGLDVDLLKKAANEVVLAEAPVGREPPLEIQRQKEESVAGSAGKIQILADFDCASALDATLLSPTHIQIELKTRILRDWFLFRLHGVAGRTVRIDIKNSDSPLDKWWPLNPMYSYAGNLTDATAFDWKSSSALPSTGWNGSSLASTDGQGWHFISDSWMDDSARFSFVQHFTADDAFVAMRVPYTPSFNEEYFKKISAQPGVTVEEIGRSARNRPLLIAEIGDGGATARRQNPCVLVYAGEHADEHDAMWVAHDVIDYLLSDSPRATQLRSHFTFLVLPMLDPDASAQSVHEGIIVSFIMAQKSQESVAYANWFQSWVNAGNRLDLVFDLHNLQSREGPNAVAALIEGVGLRGDSSLAMHNLLIGSFDRAGFDVARAPRMRGWSPDRLGGWLSRRFSPITLAYEMNSQCADHHLNLQEMSQMGQILADSAGEFLATHQGAALLSDIDARRRIRSAQWAKYIPANPTEDAIFSETMRTRISVPGADVGPAEAWVP
jgi:hypothetical protein